MAKTTVAYTANARRRLPGPPWGSAEPIWTKRAVPMVPTEKDFSLQSFQPLEEVPKVPTADPD